jgi:hypothetical protein
MLHELDSHNRVVVEEATWICPVCADAAYNCSEVNQNLRAIRRQNTLDCSFVPQVVFCATWNNNFGTTALNQFFNNEVSQKSRTTGDQNSLSYPVTH